SRQGARTSEGCVTWAPHRGGPVTHLRTPRGQGHTTPTQESGPLGTATLPPPSVTPGASIAWSALRTTWLPVTTMVAATSGGARTVIPSSATVAHEGCPTSSKQASSAWPWRPLLTMVLCAITVPAAPPGVGYGRDGWFGPRAVVTAIADAADW